MRRVLRILGTLLIVAGLGTVAWAGLVWQWQDPFTALYTHFQQNRLASSYEQRFATYRPHTSSRQLAAARREVAVEARAYRRSLRPGEAVGRLRIGRIGLDMIVVQGTDHDTLKRGPGHYVGTRLPGEGQLIYVAGHRTHLPRPVLGDRRDPARRLHHLRAAVRDVQVPRHRPSRRHRGRRLRAPDARPRDPPAPGLPPRASSRRTGTSWMPASSR